MNEPQSQYVHENSERIAVWLLDDKRQTRDIEKFIEERNAG